MIKALCINLIKNLKIDQDYEILTSCGTGGRSQRAAEILTTLGYKCSNISDGFLGNNENIGWKENNLPCKWFFFHSYHK